MASTLAFTLGLPAPSSRARAAREPDVTGDLQAFDKLKAMPEATAIRELHGALADAGVDPVLLGIEHAEDEVTLRLYNDGSYWNLAPFDTLVVGTWGWLTDTHIGVRWDSGTLPWWYGPTACIDFQAGAGAWSKICTAKGQEALQAQSRLVRPWSSRRSSSRRP